MSLRSLNVFHREKLQIQVFLMNFLDFNYNSKYVLLYCETIKAN